MTFSLCMIVKNEQDTLHRCLDSVQGVFDEIIVVDTGSTDATKDIARAHGANVFDFEWIDDFAAARNASLSHASGDYLFWLDADDVFDEENREKLLTLKSTLPPTADVVMLPYAVAFDESGQVAFCYERERLFRNHAGFRFEGFVHECVTPRGVVLHGDATVFHKPPRDKEKDSRRNLSLYEKHLAAGARLSPREQYYFARELYYCRYTERAAAELEAFLARDGGWRADKAGACLLLYEIYHRTDREKAKKSLVRALAYGKVSPQVCCLLGDEAASENETAQAIFWYKAALVCPHDYRAEGFVMPDYEAYYPTMQLCVLYDRLGDLEEAKNYHRLAKKAKPNSEAVAYNEAYFKKKDEEAAEADKKDDPSEESPQPVENSGV